MLVSIWAFMSAGLWHGSHKVAAIHLESLLFHSKAVLDFEFLVSFMMGVLFCSKGSLSLMPGPGRYFGVLCMVGLVVISKFCALGTLSFRPGPGRWLAV